MYVILRCYPEREGRVKEDRSLGLEGKPFTYNVEVHMERTVVSYHFYVIGTLTE